MAEYIDREAAISLIKQYGMDAIDGGRYSLDTVDDCIELANRIKALPAADVVPVVHGRWIEDHDYLKCPECGVMVKRDFTFLDIGDWNYCPNCGAKMDEKEAVYD